MRRNPFGLGPEKGVKKVSGTFLLTRASTAGTLEGYGASVTYGGRWDHLSRAQQGRSCPADLRGARGLRCVRTSPQGSARAVCDADVSLLYHAEPLAFGALAETRRGPFTLHGLGNVDAHAALACAPEDRRQRASLPGAVQVVSHPRRRAPSNGVSLC